MICVQGVGIIAQGVEIPAIIEMEAYTVKSRLTDIFIERNKTDTFLKNNYSWSEDDYHTGCRNVSHCQQQSYSSRSCMFKEWVIRYPAAPVDGAIGFPNTQSAG